eukprot:ANDGO_05630.mRNA.1 hypothetical protein
MSGRQPQKHAKPKKRNVPEEIKFDAASRTAFVNGFRKRKNERREKAKAQEDWKKQQEVREKRREKRQSLKERAETITVAFDDDEDSNDDKLMQNLQFPTVEDGDDDSSDEDGVTSLNIRTDVAEAGSVEERSRHHENGDVSRTADEDEDGEDADTNSSYSEVTIDAMPLEDESLKRSRKPIQVLGRGLQQEEEEEEEEEENRPAKKIRSTVRHTLSKPSRYLRAINGMFKGVL